jgi:hypothetical protein
MEPNKTTGTGAGPVKTYQTFDEFWPYYLSQHENRICRGLHLTGTSLGILIFLNGLVHGHWRAIFPALIVGYGFSWVGHFFFEKNRPATFTYPKWSFKADFKLLKLFYTGKLKAELARHQTTL